MYIVTDGKLYNMKKGVILFHSNINNIYKKRWIDECINSLLNQTDNDFTFYEINYGGEDYSVLSGKKIWQDKKFWSRKMNNYAEAMNFIIDEAFKDSCDIVFNVNLDDKYHETRIEKETEFIKKGNDIVSSDFCYIEEEGENDRITTFMLMSKYFHDIENQLERNHNIIAHPSVAYSKRFWVNGNTYNPEMVPEEDLALWKKMKIAGYKFHIIPDILLFYRIHKNQVSTKNN
jgi:hypothetical protein